MKRYLFAFSGFVTFARHEWAYRRVMHYPKRQYLATVWNEAVYAVGLAGRISMVETGSLKITKIKTR